MVAPAKSSRKAVSASEPAKSKHSSNSRSTKSSTQSTAKAKQSKRIAEAEARREWYKQYWQGKSVDDLQGMGCGQCSFISPAVDFLSPSPGKGHFEVMGGLKGSGDGSIRLCRGNTDDVEDLDIFLIPFQHIEEIIITDSNETGMLEVVIVPSHATGATPIARKYPQIIHFKWPNRDYDSALEKAIRSPSTIQAGPYLFVIKAIMDARLAAFSKQVLDFTTQAETLGSPPPFGCSARLAPIMGTRITDSVQGQLNFLPTGLLWLSSDNLYLPFNSFNQFSLIFSCDAASRQKGQDTDPIVAMSVMCHVSEPFYQAKGENGESKLMSFKDIREVSPMKDQIQAYCDAHGIKAMKMQETYYNYGKGERMTGFMPMMDDE